MAKAMSSRAIRELRERTRKEKQDKKRQPIILMRTIFLVLEKPNL